MKVFRYLSISLIGLSAFLSAMQAPAPSLSLFNHTAAWVVPMTSYTKKGKQVTYLVLGREAGGKRKGTYDAFGGDRESYDGNHPVVTAAREFGGGSDCLSNHWHG